MSKVWDTVLLPKVQHCALGDAVLEVYGLSHSIDLDKLCISSHAASGLYH